MFNLKELINLPSSMQLGFQEPATPFMLGIIDLHHTIFFYLIIIFFLISWLLGVTIYNFGIKRSANNIVVATFTHSTILEIFWTIIPSFILISIVVPSLSLLYAFDDLPMPKLTLKIIGHQWYWSYEYSNQIRNYLSEEILEDLFFDSNLIVSGDKRINLFDVDNPIYLPTYTQIRLLVTSEDVIHSWALPAFGIKIDAVPGRLNQIMFQIWKKGIFFGQCSELCGTGHGFMPIKVISF